jgi:hypothetical protein
MKRWQRRAQQRKLERKLATQANKQHSKDKELDSYDIPELGRSDSLNVLIEAALFMNSPTADNGNVSNQDNRLAALAAAADPMNMGTEMTMDDYSIGTEGVEVAQTLSELGNFGGYQAVKRAKTY